MKLRVKLTVEDFYDYLGTNPSMSLTKRVLQSMPDEFRDGYNMKFKKVKDSWRYHNWYRVSITVDITEERLQKVLDWNSQCMHKFLNFSCKPIQHKKLSH